MKISIENTGLFPSITLVARDIESIDKDRIRLKKSYEYMAEDTMGGLVLCTSDEFEWDFAERDLIDSVYVLIQLKEKENDTMWVTVYTSTTENCKKDALELQKGSHKYWLRKIEKNKK